MADQIAIHKDDVVKEGWLSKQSKYLKEWRKRWFVLTPNYLLTYKSQTMDYRNPTEVIKLRECSTVKSADDDTDRQNAFRVDSSSRVFLCIAESPQEKESWIGHIGRQMVRPTVITDED
jgi:hypothetical protein